jgi:hypothetical protein
MMRLVIGYSLLKIGTHTNFFKRYEHLKWGSRLFIDFGREPSAPALYLKIKFAIKKPHGKKMRNQKQIVARG